MKEIIYSPEYKKSILELRDYLVLEFGEKTAEKIVRKITETINLLESNEKLGKSLRSEYGMDTDYRYIFTSHNYIFYKIGKDEIYIENLFYERQDFIGKLFVFFNKFPFII